MTENLPCLIRQGENIKKYKLFILDKDEISIGRSLEVTYCVVSSMISRCHCYLRKRDDGSWTITDDKSLNGVFVNGNKIPASEPKVLQDGDEVRLGSVGSDDQQEFLYRFVHSARVKRARRESDDTGRPKKKKPRTDETDGHMLPTQTAVKHPHDPRVSGSSSESDANSSYVAYKQKIQEYQREEEEKMKEFQSRLEAMQKLLHAKEKEQAEMKEALEKEKQEKLNQGKMLEDMRKKEEKLKSELQTKQEEMRKEREEMKKEMQEELEAQLKEKERHLIEKLRQQQDSLLSEKEKIEESLKRETEKALEEKNKQLESELLIQKERLEKIIVSKELEQKVLESQLNATKAEQKETKEAMLHAREDVLNNFKDLMEVELQCSICSELFVQSTTLNCSHSFCWLCIEQWKAVKNECPICRATITSTMKSIVLDSYIDKMVEQLDEDMRNSRKALVNSRKEEEAKVMATKKAATPGGSGRGGGPGRGRNTSRRSHTASPARRTIVISDDDDDDDEEEDDIDEDDIDGDSSDSSYESGDSHVYYGGYGRCYNCGRRGHWANGCPYS